MQRRWVGLHVYNYEAVSTESLRQSIFMFYYFKTVVVLLLSVYIVLARSSLKTYQHRTRSVPNGLSEGLVDRSLPLKRLKKTGSDCYFVFENEYYLKPVFWKRILFKTGFLKTNIFKPVVRLNILWGIFIDCL